MPNRLKLAATRALLRHMIDASGSQDATQLARKAGLAHTTLTRVLADRPDGGDADITWMLSGKTWMKLSKASGVPVTLLGDEIFPANVKPGIGDAAHDERLVYLLEFWERLGTADNKDRFLQVVDAWAASLSSSATKVG